MRIPAPIVLLALLSFSGCINFVTPEPIAGKVEDTFKTRWVARRMTELQTNGTATDPRDARKIAVDEFKKKYEFTSAAQKTDPVASGKP